MKRLTLDQLPYSIPNVAFLHHSIFISSILSPPYPITPTMAATTVANTAANTAAGHISVPSIAILVNVAKMPPAGVKPPYMRDWKAAAREPVTRKRIGICLLAKVKQEGRKGVASFFCWGVSFNHTSNNPRGPKTQRENEEHDDGERYSPCDYDGEDV